MSQHENQEQTSEQLRDLTQPEEELTADQAENVRGGGMPDPWTRSSAITATVSNPAPGALLGSETFVQKV